MREPKNIKIKTQIKTLAKRYLPEIFDSASRKYLSLPRLYIFMYHEISDKPSKFANDHHLNVAPTLFKSQIKWIKCHFNVITPHDILSNKFNLPAALITFDDGSASVFRTAARILKEEDVTGTVFMNMAPVEGDIFWSGLISYMYYNSPEFRRFLDSKYNDKSIISCTEEDLNSFTPKMDITLIHEKAKKYYSEFPSHDEILKSSKNNLFLGNHLFNHFNAAVIDSRKLTEQYTINRDILETYPNYIPLFSYPFGQPDICYNDATDSKIRSFGAEKIFTALALPNLHFDSYMLHRIGMTYSINTEKLFLFICFALPLYNAWIAKNGRYR